jgi:hypothetical protein
VVDVHRTFASAPGISALSGHMAVDPPAGSAFPDHLVATIKMPTTLMAFGFDKSDGSNAFAVPAKLFSARKVMDVAAVQRSSNRPGVSGKAPHRVAARCPATACRIDA